MDGKRKSKTNSKTPTSPRIESKVDSKATTMSPSSQLRDPVAFASSASMVPPDASKIPHPSFHDQFDDGELET